MNRRYLPFRLFSGLFFTMLVLPVIVQDGMFMEGVMNSAIANNLTNGIGTWWFPRFSTLDADPGAFFHQYPPLVFWIQSFFFRVVGDGFFTERFYTLCCAGMTIYLIVVLWKRVGRVNLNVQYMEWLPLILWTLTPLTYWTFQNNMLENTGGIFILLSAICLFKYLESVRDQPYDLLALGGICIFLASFSIGSRGVYPALIPILHWLFIRKHSFSKIIIDTWVILSIPTIIYLLLFIHEPAKQSLLQYFSESVSRGEFMGIKTTEQLGILSRVFWEFWPHMLLAGLSLAWFQFRQIEWKKTLKGLGGYILFFLSLGVSGIIPILMMADQKEFHLSSTFPFFAIALALIIAPGWKRIIVKLDITKGLFKSFKFVFASLILIVLIVSAFLWKEPSRDTEVLNDINIIGKEAGKSVTIGIDPNLKEDWTLKAYLMRYYGISTDPLKARDQHIISAGKPVNEGYERLDLSTNRYDLLKKK